MLKILKPTICLTLVFLLISQPCLAFVNQPIPLVLSPASNLSSSFRLNSPIGRLLHFGDVSVPDSKTLRKFVPNFLAAVGINSASQLTSLSLRKLRPHLQYDQIGNRTQLTYPSGTILTYSYDELNRLTDINNLGNHFSYSYDVLSRRTKLDMPNTAL